VKIEVLGMGCSRCHQLYQNVLAAVKSSGQDVQVTQVEDIQKIMEYGVMSIPAIVLDGVVLAAGKVLKPEEIRKWIQGCQKERP